MTAPRMNVENRALGKMVVGGILSTAARRFRDREAIYCVATGRRLSFRQINRRCNRLAHGLSGLGFARPDVVAFLSSNRAELAEIYFALAKLGLVGIPLNYRLAPSEIAALMQAMGATGMIFDTRFVGAAEQARAALPQIRHFVAIGDGGPDWATAYEDLLAGSTDTEPDVSVEEHDPFYFNLTSGTTGLPKSYVLTHLNNAAVGQMFEAFDLTQRDVLMTVFPAFGRVGYAWIVAGILFGARNVLMDFHPGEFLRLVEQERVTIVNLVATMAAMAMAEPDLKTRDLSSLRGIVYAGSMLPAPLREKAQAQLCPNTYEYYGMQETGVLTISTPEDRKFRPESIGTAMAFADVRIERPDGSLAAPGEIGEIVGRSPATVTQYFDNPAKSAETFRGGYVHTGDLGMMDEEGFVFIRGRLKDMIVTGGQNVHAAEVEEILLALPGVADCAVFALPDDMWGERVSVLIVRDPAHGDVTAEAVEAHCRERLAGFKIPRTILFDENPLPRTPTGKVQKFLLVERFG
ncbi:MAG: AMP-binding protein [Xanthobacteraceae bacterium]|nr:AMP-binding protein [Xanthobacteraceae bacterium]